MITVKRNKQSTYNVIDFIYIGNNLHYTQTNLSINNRFNAKQIRLNNGKVLTVDKWERLNT